MYTIEPRQAEALSSDEWGHLYNMKLLKTVVESIQNETVSVWSKEVLRLTKEDDCVLEIGCGSGMSSLYLGKHGRNVTALDYSKESLALVHAAAVALGVEVNLTYADATAKLLFSDGQFDVAFQAGLLEHFQKTKRIELLKLWKPVCRTMVSMIPNAHSVAYRAGKSLQEKAGTWSYGLEIPQSSLWDEFHEAGYERIKEYTIGFEHALEFLPKEHYLRIALKRWFDETGAESDICGQGYLLVTIGETS